VPAGTWASGGTMNTARRQITNFGESNSAAIAVTGSIPPTLQALTESYDGSTWTELNDVNTAREGASSSGTQTAGLLFSGGNPGATAFTESWDGTNWTEVNDLNTARQFGAGLELKLQAF
jgi:hypothetical protein